jgi:hypothetical protein
MGITPLRQEGRMPVIAEECNETVTMSFLCNFSAQIAVFPAFLYDKFRLTRAAIARPVLSYLSFFSHNLDCDLLL